VSDAPGTQPILRVASAAALLIGALLLLASWDGLYDTLDLPQPVPALAAQIGGAALIGLAYAQWSAAARPELGGVIAGAGALADGIAAVVIAGWLIFRDPEEDLLIDTLGTVLLIATAVVLGLLALGQARVAVSARQSRG
jgi:hypothetical protein